MENDMSKPWIESAFTVTAQFKEKILELASKYPQAFMIRPVTDFYDSPWAKYNFDLTVNLWVDTTHPEAIEFYREHFSEEKEKIMSKALTTTEQETVFNLIAKHGKALGSVLPDHISVKKMSRMAHQAVILTPELARCNQLSLINAIIEASALGLEIGGGSTAQAHLIPYKGVVKFIPDYKGLVELSYRSPSVASITAHPVYSNDRFDYWYGLNSDLQHNPTKGRDRGDLIAAYAIVKFVNGGYDFEVVEKEDAMAAKARSEAKNSKYSPWNKKEDEWTMWVKTALRRLLKRVPKNPELQQAITLDRPLSEKQNIDHVIEADLINITGTSTETKKEPANQKEPEQEHTEEELKIIKNYNMSKDMFPEAFDKAVAELKLEGTMITPVEMQKIGKRASAILDREQADV